MYNKTNIKRNILTIKKIHREIGRAKDLSAPRYTSQDTERNPVTDQQLISWP